MLFISLEAFTFLFGLNTLAIGAQIFFITPVGHLLSLQAARRIIIFFTVQML